MDGAGKYGLMNFPSVDFVKLGFIDRNMRGIIITLSFKTCEDLGRFFIILVNSTDSHSNGSGTTFCLHFLISCPQICAVLGDISSYSVYEYSQNSIYLSKLAHIYSKFLIYNIYV